MKSNGIIVALLWLLSSGGAAGTLPLADHVIVRSLMARHYIPVELQGEIPVPFAVVLYLFERDDVLTVIQEEYARLLPPGEEPEFVVQQDAPNQWSYINRKNQPSVITELYRDVSGEGEAECLYYTTGRRFFGDFEALTHVQIFDMGDRIRYEVRVYAYPESDTVRFFARHMGLVRRYFVDKTSELTDLTIRIGANLIELQQKELSMEMSVIESSDEVTHVKLTGNLDMKGVEQIDLAFTAQVASRRKPTLVDMSEVPFLSSLGIRTLLTNAKALSRAGARLVLFGLQPAVAETLIQSGLDRVVPLAASAADARALLSA
jgi:anti-sigma B factor antagonist